MKERKKNYLTKKKFSAHKNHNNDNTRALSQINNKQIARNFPSSQTEEAKKLEMPQITTCFSLKVVPVLVIEYKLDNASSHITEI